MTSKLSFSFRRFDERFEQPSHPLGTLRLRTYRDDWGLHSPVSCGQGERSAYQSRRHATLALPVNRNNSIKLYGSTSLHTSAGTQYDLLGIVWQYRWGRRIVTLPGSPNVLDHAVQARERPPAVFIMLIFLIFRVKLSPIGLIPSGSNAILGRERLWIKAAKQDCSFLLK